MDTVNGPQFLNITSPAGTKCPEDLPFGPSLVETSQIIIGPKKVRIRSLTYFACAMSDIH